MELNIVDKKDHIVIKPPAGISFWEIITTIGAIIEKSEYRDKNDIWVFREGTFDITYEDLQKIKDFGRKYYPKNAKGKKTAIVVETGTQFGLAESYVSAGGEHPRKIKIFSDFKAAEDWITR